MKATLIRLLTGLGFAMVTLESQAENYVASSIVSRIKTHEGLRLCAYFDRTGYAVGYGTHFTVQGKPVIKGQCVTEAQADLMLLNHIALLEVQLTRFLDKHKQYPSLSQYNGLVSYIYNVGFTGFLRSKVATAVKAGQYEKAAKQLNKSNKGGLKGRREFEARLLAQH